MTEEPRWTQWKAYLESIADFREGGVGREALKLSFETLSKGVLPNKLLDQVSPTPRFYTYNLNPYYWGSVFDYSKSQHTWAIDVNQYWGWDGLKLPDGLYNTLQIRSRNSMMYPMVSVRGKLPDLSTFPNGTQVFFNGFENGGGAFSGIACFLLSKSADVESVSLVYGGTVWLYTTITALMPTDYKTADHVYTVKINEGYTEFLIDGELVGIILDSPNIARQNITLGPPYAVGINYGPVNRLSNTLIEIVFPYPTASSPTQNPGELTLEIRPSDQRAFTGERMPVRNLPLYQWESEDTMRGASIAAGTLTSHPFPAVHPEKTIFFRADQAGTLDIEVYLQSGNWRTYDSIAIVTDILTPYNMSGESLLGRVVYSPDAFPAVISEAEVLLR